VAAAWSASQKVSAPVWSALRGFRLGANAGHAAHIDLRLHDVSAATSSEAVRLFSVNGSYALFDAPRLRATVQQTADGAVVHLAQEDQPTIQVHVRQNAQQRWFTWAQARSMVWDVEHELAYSLHAGTDAKQETQLEAKLPGRISELMVQVGQRVAAGDAVLTLEAMKLYHSFHAPVTGCVQKVHVTLGDIVSHGQLLVEFEPEAADAAAA
jgi:biotin carboxyl carrier protein